MKNDNNNNMVLENIIMQWIIGSVFIFHVKPQIRFSQLLLNLIKQ